MNCRPTASLRPLLWQGGVDMNIQISPAMQARIDAAMTLAHCQRGPSKGHIKAKCPPMGTDAAIYWQAVQMATNPFKVSVMQLIFLTPDQRELFDAVEAVATAAKATARR